MVEYISKKVTDRLLSNEVIESDDSEIYRYGLERLLTNIINIMTLLAISLAMGMIWQGTVFVASFMFLRRYAGGYHTSTPLRCYFLTSFVIAGTLSVIKYLQIDTFIYLGLAVFSSSLIILLSPVESVNKRLDNIEKMIYRRKTIFVWCAEMLLLCVGIFLKRNELTSCISLACCAVCLSQLAEMISFQIWKHKISCDRKDGVCRHGKSDK